MLDRAVCGHGCERCRAASARAAGRRAPRSPHPPAPRRHGSRRRANGGRATPPAGRKRTWWRRDRGPTPGPASPLGVRPQYGWGHRPLHARRAPASRPRSDDPDPWRGASRAGAPRRAPSPRHRLAPSDRCRRSARRAPRPARAPRGRAPPRRAGIPQATNRLAKQTKASATRTPRRPCSTADARRCISPADSAAPRGRMVASRGRPGAAAATRALNMAPNRATATVPPMVREAWSGSMPRRAGSRARRPAPPARRAWW